MSYGVGLRNGVAFALGTIPSLTSGGGLRPSLLLNFLSGTLDSRITFSRGTQATQYTSNGTLQYAPNNLLTYSNQADNVAWTKSNSFVQTNLLQYSNAFTTAPWNVRGTATATANSITSPDGTQNGWLIAGIGVLLNDVFQQITVASGVSYTPSFWIKRVSTTGTLQIANPSGTNGAMNLNMALLSNDWERITPSHPAVTLSTAFSGSATNTGGIHLLNSSGGLLSFYLYGAQVVLGSVPGDYRATTSAALPVLYADYNGALRARKLCEDATAAVQHRAIQTITLPLGAETASIYAKAGERTKLLIDCSDNTTGNATFRFDLVAGTATSVSSTGSWTGVTGAITFIGSGWYRCTLTAIRGAGTQTVLNFNVLDAGGSSVYTGDGSSGIYIADAQLEAGSTVQAYNDTTSAAYYGPRFDYDPTNLVRQNLLTYSEQFDNAAWGGFDVSHIVSANSAIAPDGTLTADAWTWPASTTNYGFGAQTITGDASQAYTFSVWARLQTGAKNVRLKISNVSVATLNSADIGLTTTWQRISYSIAAGALARTTQVGVAFAIGSSSSVGAGDIIELWGAQLNTGSTALTYTATTTAPYTLVAARGLLIEEQRTNYMARSSDFSNAVWNDASPNIPTVTTDAILSPDGTVNADLLTASTGGTACAARQVASTGTTGNFTGSVLLKAGTSTRSRVLIADATSGFTVIGDFQIAWAAGVASVFSTTSGTASIVASKDGWYRCVISASTASANAIMALAIFPDVVLGTNTVYAYGAQLEAGAFATSYIPTVASQVTRSADSASVNTLTPWFNAAAGTMFGSGTRYNVAANAGSLFEIGDGTNNNRLLIFGNSPTPNGSFFVANGGVTQAFIEVANGFTVSAAGKIAAAYALNDFQQASNAVLGTADTSGTLPTVTTAYIGKAGSGATTQWNGWISSISYYPTRLPNATLQSLTV